MNNQSSSNKIVVGDADSLVALAYKDDSNHIKAQKVISWLVSKGYEIIYPNTAILEAITALKSSLNLKAEAHLLNRQYQSNLFTVEYIDEHIHKKASQRFEKTVSKKDTIFDALVAETAVELQADYIFSFDKWFQKQGFKMLIDHIGI